MKAIVEIYDKENPRNHYNADGEDWSWYPECGVNPGLWFYFHNVDPTWFHRRLCGVRWLFYKIGKH